MQRLHEVFAAGFSVNQLAIAAKDSHIHRESRGEYGWSLHS
jgi:hypothetical protein